MESKRIFDREVTVTDWGFEIATDDLVFNYTRMPDYSSMIGFGKVQEPSGITGKIHDDAEKLENLKPRDFACS